MKIKKETAPVGTESTQDNYITAKQNIKTLVLIATKEHPATREHMEYATGYPDRRNRKIIEELRKEGVKICSTSHQGGYWVARTESEYKAFRTEYLSGAYKRLETVKAMDEFIEEQIEMEG